MGVDTRVAKDRGAGALGQRPARPFAPPLPRFALASAAQSGENPRIVTELSDRRRALGIGTCVLLGLTTIVGGGIFALPAILAGLVGPLSPLAWLGAAVAITFVGLMTAEAAGTTDRPGGAYQYAKMAFGAPVGFAVGWVAWANTILAWAGISLILVGLLEMLEPGLGTGTRGKGIATLEILVFGAINAAGVKPGAFVSNVLTVAKLVPLVFFIGIGLLAFQPASFDGATARLAAAGVGGAAAAVYRCIFAVGGFENIGVVAGEVRDPKKTIPRAVLLAIGGSTALYALIQLAAVSAIPGLAAFAPTPQDPGSLALPKAARVAGEHLWSPGFGAACQGILVLGAIVSIVGFCSGIALVSPRYLATMAADGFVPAALVRENRKGTPVVAIWTVTLLSVALLWSVDFRFLMDAAVLFSLTQHATTVCSAWRLRSRVPKENRFVAPGGPLVPIAALAAIVGLLWFAYAPAEDGSQTISARDNFIALAELLGAAALVALVTRLFKLQTPTIQRS
jgi:amino acid transporter